MQGLVARMGAGAVLTILLLAGNREISAKDAASRESRSEVTSYCQQTGGAVDTLSPAYNTNGGQPLILAGKQQFCVYSATDGSKIFLLLSTLSATQPSLAALAYYAEVQPTGGEGNPASAYCSQLGGSDLFGGVNAAGGGWVGKNGVDDVLEACMFPDMSSIDSWGLYYHSAGIIRGIDLSTVLKYQPQ
ncbi:MAG TPA: hypothetical protein VI455_04620 [Terriglobia bacterium]